MADSDITALTEDTAPLGGNLAYEVDEPSGTPADKKIVLGSVNLYAAAPAQGGLRNGYISRSVASSNLTVAIKTLSGSDPSADDPVYVRIGNTVRKLTAALSVTKNAGTNWCSAGSSELATKEIDYFVYMGYNATDGVVIGFCRIPYARTYSQFNTTSTNERYCAISTITNAASTDEYEVVGRFNATLSAGAGYTWSVPATSVVVSRPIFETRSLSFTPTHSRTGTNYTNLPTANQASYVVDGIKCKVYERHTQNGTPGGTNYQRMTLPFTNSNASYSTQINASNLTAGTLFTFYVVNNVAYGDLYKYDGTSEATGSSAYAVEGEYWIG